MPPRFVESKPLKIFQTILWMLWGEHSWEHCGLFLLSNNIDFIFSWFRNIMLMLYMMPRTLVLKKCESDDKLAAMQVNERKITKSSDIFLLFSQSKVWLCIWSKNFQAQLDRMESQIALLVSLYSTSAGGLSKDVVRKYHAWNPKCLSKSGILTKWPFYFIAAYNDYFI